MALPTAAAVLLATATLLLSVAALAQAPVNGVQATTVPLLLPGGLAYDSNGNLYIAATNDHVVRVVSPAGVVNTYAGTGAQGFSGDGGAATSAQLDSPTGIAVDSSNNVYIADTHNNRIREVLASTGAINTIAGTGAAGFGGDGGVATSAVLNYPTAVAVDSAGNVYIADSNNHHIRSARWPATASSSLAATADWRRRLVWTRPTAWRWTARSTSTSATRTTSACDW
jgi:sugar lactone lactonase YvrE